MAVRAVLRLLLLVLLLQPCKFGYTSAVGSTSARDCYSVDQCPAGTGEPFLSEAAQALFPALLRQHKARPWLRHDLPFTDNHHTLCPHPFPPNRLLHAEVPSSMQGASTTQECRCKVRACVARLPHCSVCVLYTRML